MINKILHGDCLDIIPTLPPVNLVYLDPPWFTQQDWGMFTDKWDDLDAYLLFIRERLMVCRDVLKETGSIYVHCDNRTSHYIKVEMDKIFGYHNFLNDITWQKLGSYAIFKMSYRKWAHTSDNILFYRVTSKYTFNKMHTPITDECKSMYKKVNENGRLYKDIFYGRPQNYTIYKKYLDDDMGIPVRDVWLDIPSLSTVSTLRRSNYPTEKPLRLLERIVRASSNMGDLVLDPMCGSGTTCVAAKLLGRDYVGVDVSEEACRITRKRLEETPVNVGAWFR